MAKRPPLMRRLMHLYWRFSRGLTVGVRGLVLDGEGRVFLVKHTYTEGWHLPGGGVEAGETLLEALAHELRDEGNIELTGPPVLHAIYFQPAYSRRDHVATLRCPRISPDRAASAEPRDRRAWVLSARCAAARHHGRHPRTDRRGHGWQARRGTLVTARHRHYCLIK